MRQALNGVAHLLAEGAQAPHARACDYLAALGRARWDAIVTLATVRNPYARLVSCWAYTKATAPVVSEFRRWVRVGCPVREQFHLNLGDGRMVWIHAPQRDWIADASGAVVVRHLLRQERLASDWGPLAGVVGGQQALNQRNVSEHQAVRDYYDRETAERVAERYAPDFALLGYDPKEIPE